MISGLLPDEILLLIRNVQKENEQMKWFQVHRIFSQNYEVEPIKTNKELEDACKHGYYVRLKKIMETNEEYDWNRGLGGACQGGHIDLVEKMVDMGATNVDYGFIKACRGGHLNLMNKMIERGAIDFNRGLIELCKGEHCHLLDNIFKIKDDTNDWDYHFNIDVFESCFHSACKRGNLFLIEKLSNKVTELNFTNYLSIFNRGLEGACEGGHLHIIEKMVKMGATDWDMALRGASRGHRIDIIKKILEENTVDLLYGIEGACEGCHNDILLQFLEKNPKKYTLTLYYACKKHNVDMINTIIESGNYSSSSLTTGAYGACYGGHLDIVEKMLEMGADARNIGMNIARLERHNDILNRLLLE